jgi:hypothetical protein
MARAGRRFSSHGESAGSRIVETTFHRTIPVALIVLQAWVERYQKLGKWNASEVVISRYGEKNSSVLTKRVSLFHHLILVFPVLHELGSASTSASLYGASACVS